VLSLQIISTQLLPPPLTSGYYVSKSKLINDESVEPDKEEKEEEKRGRDSPIFRNDKYAWNGGLYPSMGSFTLTKDQPTVRVTSSSNAVRISRLSVNTGSSVLGKIYFSDQAHVQQALYIDNLFLDSDSFLEFDIGHNLSVEGVYVFTRHDYSYILNRVGFFDPKDGIRYKAVSRYWSDGTYCISLNPYENWHPPMVPEPTTYGAGLMGMGLVAVGYRSYLRRRQAARINGVIRLSHF